MRSFVIHMSSSAARRPNADILLSQLPDAELVEAVNGRDPSQVGHVHQHPGTLHRPHYPFQLRPTEIGVFQSHRKLWQKIVDDGLDYAITTEDDLGIDPERFQSALEFLTPHLSPDCYVRIPVKQREKPAKVIAQANGFSLILPRIIGLQCVCQVIGRNAAARLLKATEQIDRPVDTFLQMHWITRQPILSLLGTGNREMAAQIGGSTIQAKIPAQEKLFRELKRASYRAKLHLQPQKAASIH